MSFVNRKKKIFMLRKHSVLHLKQRKSVCWLTKSAASEELVGITGGRVDSVRRIQGYYSILYIVYKGIIQYYYIHIQSLVALQEAR